MAPRGQKLRIARLDKAGVAGGDDDKVAVGDGICKAVSRETTLGEPQRVPPASQLQIPLRNLETVITSAKDIQALCRYLGQRGIIKEDAA